MLDTKTTIISQSIYLACKYIIHSEKTESVNNGDYLKAPKLVREMRKT